MTDLFFKIEICSQDMEDIDDFGKDLAVFLEEYLCGEMPVDVRYIGRLK